MNKKESQNLMIGSWVLAEGKPRQVHILTTKKAGFKRGTNGHLDFFRFDQLQGIPLSEPLLKECVTVNPPKMLINEYMSVEFMLNMVVIKDSGETVDYLQFSNLHTMQSFFLSRYGCIVEFDVDKYNWLRQPEMVVSREGIMRLATHTSVDIEKLKFNSVSGCNILKRIETLRAKDGHNVVSDHIPTTDLGKDDRGFQYGQLTYKK